MPMMTALMVSFMMLMLFGVVSPESFNKIGLFWEGGWFINGYIRCLWKGSVLMSVSELKMHSISWLRGSNGGVGWLNWLWRGCFCFLKKLRELSQRFRSRLCGWHCIRFRWFLCWRIFLFFMLGRRWLSQESQCCLILRWQHLLLFNQWLKLECFICDCFVECFGNNMVNRCKERTIW